MSLLHSFEFSRAIAGFNAALAADPSCAMADWGIALSRWSNFFAPGVRPAGVLRQGLDAVTQAKAIGLKTPRENAYVEAVSQLYTNIETSDQPARVMAYRDRMAALAADYPDDTEASIFYALALAAAASPSDKTYADLLKAGGILEGLFATQPDHPGLAHYIIHSYDVPPLAGHALAAARRYAIIAPASPHALHMPAHTFTRLGLWQESIDSNIAAADVAKRTGVTAEELHSMDYRVYAYLQTGQDAAARRLLDALPEVKARFDPNAIGSGAPGSAGSLRPGGDSGAVRARARRMGRGREAGGAGEPLPVSGGDDVLREGHRRHAHRRQGHRARRDRRAARNPRSAGAAGRALLGRTDRDSAALRLGVAGVYRGTSDGSPRRDAGRRRDGGRHGEVGRHAGPAGAGPRAGRRDAAAR